MKEWFWGTPEGLSNGQNRLAQMIFQITKIGLAESQKRLAFYHNCTTKVKPLEGARKVTEGMRTLHFFVPLLSPERSCKTFSGPSPQVRWWEMLMYTSKFKLFHYPHRYSPQNLILIKKNLILILKIHIMHLKLS